MQPEDLHVVVLSRAVAPLHGVGGLERHGHDLLLHLLERGVRVTLITQPRAARGSSSEELFRHDRLAVKLVPYRTFPFAGRRGTTIIDRSSAYPAFGWRAGRLAAALVREGGIHLVHGMGAASLGFARARLTDRYGTVPLVFNPHGMEEFGSTGPRVRGLKRLAYAPLRRAVRFCAQAADRIIATDRALVPTVIEHLSVPASRVSVVPNAVDVRRIDRLTDPDRERSLRARIGLSESDALLLGVGRLEQNKGFQDLVAALASLTAEASADPERSSRRWRCVVLGEGPYRSQLERDIESAGLGEKMLLPGRVSESDLHAWYDAATVFVHPTRYEGSSIVTLEAMTHRRAVIATSTGGLPDKVRAGLNGWLLPPGDPGALASALEEALKHPDRLGGMGEKSRAIVESEFAWTTVAEQLLVLYNQTLSATGG